MSKLYEASESYRRAFQNAILIPPVVIAFPNPTADMLTAVEIIDNVVPIPKSKTNVVPIIIVLLMLGAIGYLINKETKKRKKDIS